MKDKLSRFFRAIFKVLDLSNINEYLPSVYGPKGYSRHALFRSFVVMKFQSINQITDLKYFIDTHHSIAELCGFNLSKVHFSLELLGLFGSLIIKFPSSSTATNTI